MIPDLPTHFEKLSDVLKFRLQQTDLRYWLRKPPQRNDSPAELFRMSGRLYRAGFSEYEREQILRAWFDSYYRPITDREFHRAVTRVCGDTNRVSPKWPDPEQRRIDKVITSAAGALEDLRARSTPEPQKVDPAVIIDSLFPAGSLLCFARGLSSAETQVREHFRGRERQYQFLVPNPMSSRRGMTDTGSISCRCLANTGPLTYQVVEFDFGTLEEQAALHLHLARMLPLRLVVFSGNKSLHGWYDVKTREEATVTRFRRYAAALGADKATFTPCQLVRMPNGQRDNGVTQSVLFFHHV
jgi:hypothetical protein